MSRIDDAIRRAAELQAKAAQAGAEPAGPHADTGAVPADEAYPAESFGTEPAAPSADVMRRTMPEPPAPPVEQPVERAEVVEPATPSSRTPSLLFERIDRRYSEKVIVDREIMPASREQYRRLAAVLHDGQAGSGMKVVMIASAVSGEGKTLTASNLALTFSESYRRRVLLVDGDLRKPVLHSIFGVHAASGLSEGLRSPENSKLVVRQVSPCLSVLPGGRPDNDPMAGLTSHRMRRVIDEAKEAFDWIIVDTPPLVLLPDAHLLASMADAVVLVVRAHSTPHELIRRAVDAIGKERIAGVVLNATADVPAGADDYYYGYGSSQGLELATPRP